MLSATIVSITTDVKVSLSLCAQYSGFSTASLNVSVFQSWKMFLIN